MPSHAVPPEGGRGLVLRLRERQDTGRAGAMIDQAVLWRELDKIDWDKLLQYGTVEVRVEGGKAVLGSVKETSKPN